MKRFFKFALFLFIVTVFYSTNASADVVLTFDQDGISNFAPIDKDYGDRVVSSPDSNGHAYDLVPASELFTPNVEVEYSAGGSGLALWTTGYGDLTNVLFADNFATELKIELTADSGFEVGLSGFDLAAFGSDLAVGDIEVLDGSDNVLWSAGPTTTLSSTTRNSFDTSGIFADSLSIVIDLDGLGGNADSAGIDNIQFSQRSAVPEPTGASILLLGLIGLISRRQR